MRQIAIIMTNTLGSGTSNDPYRFILSDQLELNEVITDVVNKPGIDNETDSALLIKIEADETRIALLDGTAHKVIWKRYVDGESAVSGFNPGTPFTAAQVSAMNTFMQNKYSVTGTQIANWFGISAAQLSNWLQTHPKSEAVEKLIIAWRQKIWK